MNFFKKFKASGDTSKEEVDRIQWHNLTQMDQLEKVIAESQEKPVAIFKHSTRCGVSRGVLKAFEKSFSLSEDEIILYFLDLLANRNISNEIATKFKVRHESPQMIVIKNGEVVYSESHNSIDGFAEVCVALIEVT